MSGLRVSLLSKQASSAEPSWDAKRAADCDLDMLKVLHSQRQPHSCSFVLFVVTRLLMSLSI